MAPRFEDSLPRGTEAEWTCGHVGGAVCAECYRLLAAKAHELQMEVDRLHDSIRELHEHVRSELRKRFN